MHTQIHPLLPQTAELLVSSVIACLQLKTYNLLKSKIEGPDSKTTENVVFTKTNAKNRLFSVQKLTIDRDRTNCHPRKRFSFMKKREQSIDSRVYLSKKAILATSNLFINLKFLEIWLSRKYIYDVPCRKITPAIIFASNKIWIYTYMYIRDLFVYVVPRFFFEFLEIYLRKFER